MNKAAKKVWLNIFFSGVDKSWEFYSALTFFTMLLQNFNAGPYEFLNFDVSLYDSGTFLVILDILPLTIFFLKSKFKDFTPLFVFS